jgi:membrane-associated PAP2 superfamily phosphatase
MRVDRQFALTTAFLLVVLALFEFTSLDAAVQDQFFNRRSGQWLVDATAPLPRLVFYTGAKGLIISFAVLLLGFVCWPARHIATPFIGRRRDALFLLSCLAIVPLVIGQLKQHTNVYCPYELQRYGGNKPYIRVFEPRTEIHQKEPGKGYPAGHASGGFALLSLFFVGRTRRAQNTGLCIGLFAGWAMGLYQMFKGAHFLSHTIVTMLLAWMMILLLAKCFKPSAMRPTQNQTLK